MKKLDEQLFNILPSKKEIMSLRDSKSVSIELVGGIGNQLFIYFAGYYLCDISKAQLNIKAHSLHNRRENIVEILKLPHHKMKKTNFTKGRFISKVSTKLSQIWSAHTFLRTPSTFHANELGFEPSLQSQKPPIKVFGYFQTYKYFEAHREVFCKYFDQFAFVSKEASNISIEIENDSVLMVHIRLGDYLKPENRYFGSLDETYYVNAIKRATSSNNFSKIVVISDDVYSAKKLFLIIENQGLPVVWFDNQSIKTSVELLMLMRNCKGFVIANSTFSWWIANLSKDPKIVVAPYPWFKESKTPDSLYPVDWVKVDSSWREF